MAKQAWKPRMLSILMLELRIVIRGSEHRVREELTTFGSA